MLGLASIVASLRDPAKRVTVVIVLAVSLVAVFLVGASVWAKEQVIGGQPLDKLSVGDKFVVWIFLAGAASAAWQGLGAIRNIGDNQPK